MSSTNLLEQTTETHVGLDLSNEPRTSSPSIDQPNETSSNTNITPDESNRTLEQDQNIMVATTLVATRVPGTYPPEWLPDNEADSCMSCDTLFTLIKRRHHCRACGKIFCGDCCQKAKLLYLDNKLARVCRNCFRLIQCTLSDVNDHQLAQDSSPSSSNVQTVSNSEPKVQGVLKTGINARPSTTNECNTSSSSASDQQLNKQVIFADGIRPGTDLSESFPYPVASSSSTENSSSVSFTFLSRQNRSSDDSSSNKKGRRNHMNSHKNITCCDELGYLPPIIVGKNAKLFGYNTSDTDSHSASSHDRVDHKSRTSSEKDIIQTSMESRSCPLNGVIKFEEISGLVGDNDVVTFLLLKDFYLRVKLVKKFCCIDRNLSSASESPYYWCFTSDGLARFGQNEIVMVIDKDQNDSCIPRDVFKIYLTLHELALRRQSLDNLGNLLFQDGLFGNRDTAGLLFVRPLNEHCLKDLILPNKTYLFALVLQRWEVPWSKVFPMRLLLRLGHKFEIYPYPIISFRSREPVYYEVGHTIISILGDFRNFKYSLTHVDGMKVMLNKTSKKVLVQLDQSSYQQVNKVLDSSNNEHVLAWGCCPFSQADGHLVSVQNEDGQYETVEFLKKPRDNELDSSSNSGMFLGASFIIFSGALKVNQSGQSAKISIVEDGLLIQVQSCTMSALRNAIHFMHHFDIDCGKYKCSLKASQQTRYVVLTRIITTLLRSQRIT